MRYFWTLFWTFLLVHMTSYVVSSMQGGEYLFGTSSIIAIVVSVIFFVLGEVAADKAPEETH